MPADQLRTPEVDLAHLTDQLGQAWGVGFGEPIIQYLAWAEMAGIFSLIGADRSISLKDIHEQTILNEDGADALVCILLSVGLLQREGSDCCTLSLLAKEYLLNNSPYYIGHALWMGCNKRLPQAYLKGTTFLRSNGTIELRKAEIIGRLRVQHGRNFGPSVMAARTGEFDDVVHLLDMGGGTGVFAIPLALDHPRLRITLVDLPQCLPGIREILSNYRLDDQIELVGMDIFTDQWRLPQCDGILWGNVFHVTNDEACSVFCRKSLDLLVPNGKLWLHEVLLNDNRDGPLIAALWNANMRMVGGRQRTASELVTMLKKVGFVNCYTKETAGRFSLVAGQKAPAGLST